MKSKIVKPKKIKLQLEEGRLKVAQDELAKFKAELEKIQAILGDLREKFTR